ncbi:MAG: hypothetical protein IJV05_10675 [Muribaculaceae bacterium]|nr:hypothetical protein [Muribaculaceae bacterium]
MTDYSDIAYRQLLSDLSEFIQGGPISLDFFKKEVVKNMPNDKWTKLSLLLALLKKDRVLFNNLILDPNGVIQFLESYIKEQLISALAKINDGAPFPLDLFTAEVTNRVSLDSYQQPLLYDALKVKDRDIVKFFLDYNDSFEYLKSYLKEDLISALTEINCNAPIPFDLFWESINNSFFWIGEIYHYFMTCSRLLMVILSDSFLSPVKSASYFLNHSLGPRMSIDHLQRPHPTPPSIGNGKPAMTSRDLTAS